MSRYRAHLRALVVILLGMLANVPAGHKTSLLRADDGAPSECALVRIIETSRFVPPSPDPAGITYLPDSDTLLVSDSEVDETDLFSGASLFEMSLSGALIRTASTEVYSGEPTGVVLDTASGHIFVSDDNADRVARVAPGPDEMLHTDDDVVTFINTEAFGADDPEDVAVDVERGHLYILEGKDAKVFRLTPGANGVLDGVPPDGDDEVAFFETSRLGITDPEGLAFDAASGHLLVVGQPPTEVAEITTTGKLVRILDISAANARKPSALVLAPGSVNPEIPSLYIADRGVDNASDRDENDGKVYELSVPLIPGNFAPEVDAGPDQNVALPGTVDLRGGVTDDGAPDPPGRTEVAWTQVSGLGTVTFSNANSLETRASFSIAGEYILRLSASDGAQIGSDECSVIVSGTRGEMVAEFRVADGADDAEEITAGTVRLRSTDLEIVFDGGANQIIGVRFSGVEIPKFSSVFNAYVQFHADEEGALATVLTLQGEDVDDARPFTGTRFDISSRPRTTAAVEWTPPPWTRVDEAGVDQRTTNAAPILNEIFSHPGWRRGNSLVMIITGSGRRVAASFNESPEVAPLLHIEYFPLDSIPSPFRRGDADNDGNMNVSDSVRILIYLFADSSLRAPCLESADVNDDFKVDLADAIYGLAFLFARGPAPPIPFPHCGPDATPDLLGCESYECDA